MNANYADLEKKFPGEGLGRFAQIAALGGFGAVGPGEGDLDSATSLDLVGVLDPENKAVPNANKEKIKQLAGLGEAKKDVK